MIVKPNNDMRPDYDADGRRLTGRVNDEWIYEPTMGMLEVIADCGEHVGWLSKDRIGAECPQCPVHCSKSLGGKIETPGAKRMRLYRERKKNNG